jgi:hypothetical protein
MDFNSIGVGSPFYILRKGDKPILEQGIVKEKSAPQPKYQPQGVPSAYNGMGMQHVTSITVTVNGNDRVITDIPINVEIAARGNETFTGSREAMIQAVDSMIQASKKALTEVDYHKMVIGEGDKMLEALNPNYKEEKQRAQSIHDLQEKSNAQDKRLATLEQQSAEMLNILRALNGGPAKADKS